jgi:hypothetical protein
MEVVGGCKKDTCVVLGNGKRQRGSRSPKLCCRLAEAERKGARELFTARDALIGGGSVAAEQILLAFSAERGRKEGKDAMRCDAMQRPRRRQGSRNRGSKRRKGAERLS